MLLLVFTLLTFNILALAQPNPAIPVTIGSGCETFTLAPPSGTSIPSGTEFQLLLKFNQNSEYYLSPVYRNQLTSYSPNGPLTYQNLLADLNSPNSNSPAAIFFRDVTHANNIILPVNATTFGYGNQLLLTFAGSQLLPGSYLQLYVANRWMDGNYQNFLAPYLGYATYVTTGGTFGETYPTPPTPPYCPLSSHVVNLSPPSPNTSPSLVYVVASPCNGTLAGYPCNWTLKIDIDFAASQGYDQNFTSFFDNVGDVYTLQYPIRVQLTKLDTSVNIPLIYQKTYTPVLEHIEANVTALSGSSMIWEESLRQIAQGYLNDFANGIASSLYLVHLFRYWQPGDSLNATEIEQQTETSGTAWIGTFTYPNGTVIQMHYSPRGLRPNNRWWRAFVNEREGISCPIGSIRNVFCPMCQNEIHAWNSVLQMPYGTYTANVDGSSLVLGTSARFRYNTVDDNVNFFNQPTEIAPTRVFVATTTIPSLSSLSQVSALTNNRLMLPDLLTNPNTPPTEWRLVPLQYFGGGCDTLDVNPQDFVRQPNFCNSTYGTCLNYGVSYWLKSNATLDQLFTNYNLLHGNFVDPTNQVKNRIRVEGSNLVLTYNKAPERVRVFMEINPQRANFVFLQPQIGPWTFTEFVINNSHALNITVTNNGSASGYFFVGANCAANGIQTIGSGQRLAAGQSAVLQLVLDATATTLTGVFTCDVFVTIRQQQFWPPVNYYQSLPYAFTLYQGCADPTNSEAYLNFDYETWISFPDPFQNNNNPFSVPSTLPAWTQLDATRFTTIVNATVKNGGNATATFTGEITCNNTILFDVQSFGSISLDPGVSDVLPVNVTAKGTNVTNATVTCSLHVQVIRKACWSTLGKSYSQNVNFSAPYGFCATYDSGEPYLLFSRQEWLVYNETLTPPPNGSLALSIPGEWSSFTLNSTQLWSVVVSASLSNKGVVPGTVELTAECPNSPIQVFTSSQSRCTAFVDKNCTALIALVTTIVPTPEYALCTISASVQRTTGDVSMCWSTLGKFYSEPFAILLPTATSSGTPPPTSWSPPSPRNPVSTPSPSPDMGILGIGVAASIVVIVIIVLVGAGIIGAIIGVIIWKVHKRNTFADDDFDGFEPDEEAETRMRIVGKSLNGPDPIPMSPRQLSPWYPLSHYILNSPPDKNSTTTNENQQTGSQIPVPPLVRVKTESETQNSNVTSTGNANNKEKKSTTSPVSTTKQTVQPATKQTVQPTTQLKPNNSNTNVQNITNTNVSNNSASSKNDGPQKSSTASVSSSNQNSSASSVSRVPTAGVSSKSPKALNEKESDSSKGNSSEESGPSTAPKKN